MKVVILAGGFGTRLGDDTEKIPKPMVEIGGKPILWHIMKMYSSYGFHEFIICCGYKGYLIKEYFYNYFMHNSDMTINTEDNKIEYHSTNTERWRITLVDTGVGSLTATRIKMIEDYLGQDKTFMLTYGDGLSNVNIPNILDKHNRLGKLATVTAVKPIARFGVLEIDENFIVKSIKEKSQDDVHWINGGFFVLDRKVFDYIPEENVMWEDVPLKTLIEEKQLVTYYHKGFWQCMDTKYDKGLLEDLWNNNKAEWKIW